MLKKAFLDKVIKGEKKATVRLGIVKPRYREMIIHSGGRPVAKILLTDVKYKKVSSLTDQDALEDGLSNRDELIRVLKEMYGDVRPDDIVSIIRFKLLQLFNDIKPEKPYGGLKPVDVARLGLRYLKHLLKDEEIRILRALTVYESLRLTSIKLYGDLGKRWIIRKVLKKTYKHLLEKGFLGKSLSEQHSNKHSDS